MVRTALVESLRLHPRVAQQGIGSTPAARLRLATLLPSLVPFRGRSYHQVVALLDWDHRLPSKQLVLRLHAVYGRAGLDRLEEALAHRGDEIRRRDLYPEFDVPDYSDLPGDESYDADLDANLTVEAVRLVSPWRRDIEPDMGNLAVRAVRASPAFGRAKANYPSRSPNLGDLEAVAWMPPCESGQPSWTLDVWWLTAFDGRIGKGWSFLVDTEIAPPADRVVAHREFTVRTS